MHVGQLDLPAAIELSYRMQPRLRVFMESIAQARAPLTWPTHHTCQLLLAEYREAGST